MKRFTYLLPVALLLLGFQANAQYFSENFETGTGLPTGWTQTSLATDGGFLRGTAAALSSQYWTIPSHTKILATNDDDCNCNKSADVLTSPAFDLSASTHPRLKVDAYFLHALANAGYETAEIQISTNGTSWTNIKTLTGVGAWQTVVIDLTAYAGEASVKLRFTYDDAGGWMYGVALDNVLVFEPATNEITLSELDVPEYVLEGKEVLKGTVQNNGGIPMTSFDATYTVNGGPAQTYNFSGLNISPLGYYTFTHPDTLSLLTAGEYNIIVTVAAPNGATDGNAADNKDTIKTTALTQIPPKNVLVEEFTGAWCQYCPDGAVVLDNIMNNSTRVIGISVHDNDGMSFTDGNSIIAQFADGFPSGIVDRHNFERYGGVSLSRTTWEDAVNERLDALTPASIATRNVYDTTTRELAVEVSTEFFAPLTGNFRMNVMIVEDGVTGTGSGYNQVNAYNGQVGHEYYQAGNPIVGFVHNQVLRSTLGGPYGLLGSIPTTLVMDTTYSRVFTTTLPAGWNADNVKVVAVIHEYSSGADGRKILNAEEDELRVMGVTATSTNASCTGGANGSVSVDAAMMGPLTYMWNTGDVTPSLTNVVAGTYSVTVSDTSGHQFTAEATVTEPANVNCTTGIGPDNNDIVMGVSPNPTSGMLNLNLVMAVNHETVVEVFSLVGEKVYENRLGVTSNANLEIDLGKVASGMYLVKVSADGNTVMRKVQVSK